MATIESILSKPSLTQTLRANEKFRAQFLYEESIEVPEYVLSFADANAEMPGLNAARAVRIMQIDRIEKAFLARHCAPAIWMDPFAPSDLAAKLRKRGYERSSESTERWWGLAFTEKTSASGVGGDFEFLPAKKHFGEFLALVTSAFALPKALSKKIGERLQAAGTDAAAPQPWIARRDGKTVASACFGLVGTIGFFSLLAQEDDDAQATAALLAHLLPIAQAQGATIAVSVIPVANASVQEAAETVGFEALWTNELFLRDR